MSKKRELVYLPLHKIVLEDLRQMLGVVKDTDIVPKVANALKYNIVYKDYIRFIGHSFKDIEDWLEGGDD